MMEIGEKCECYSFNTKLAGNTLFFFSISEANIPRESEASRVSVNITCAGVFYPHKWGPTCVWYENYVSESTTCAMP